MPHSAPPDMNLHEHQAKVQLDFIGRQLGLADIPLLGYTLNYTAADLEAVRQQLRPAGESSKAFLIGCNMGCSRLARRGLKFWKPLTHPKVWATTHLLAFDSLLRARFAHARLVLIGAGSEAGIAKAFCKKSPHTISMAGRTTVSQLAALVDQLDGVISSDTGLLHVACARRKKLVALHGPSNPARTGPFPPHDAYHVIQRKTMDDITPGLVMQALIDYRWFS